MDAPKLYAILSENWTMTDPRDLRGFVDHATVLEDAGFTGVMLGEHVTMGPHSDHLGAPENPRDWLKSGNQPPDYPHPSGLHVLSAMAAVTSRLQLLAGAVLTPLRHPLALAKDLATLDLISRGRLTFIPGVSWQREEYEALGVDFAARGAILDEQLAVWKSLWTDGSPVTHRGRHFSFDSMHVEPQPHRAGGPPVWIGGRAFAPFVKRRAVAYGQGLFTIVPPSPDQLAELREDLDRAGRDPDEFRLASFLFGPPFTGPDDLLDVDDAIAAVPELVERGFDTFVLKPSQFIDDGAELGDFCRDVRDRIARM